ncbi:LamG domain-containing protein [Sulfurimonas sp. SWIR-19]|uniref:LamG domain-containing protein n=1 Tax=Sulfurimonas sp. SWIR-19 TaxID=2878390 RepID=UPI001CF0E1D4|nr:LamG domain-containing protein [Sulfurimonas sp. SWIR-19]UCN00793.1 LamG domain-containing protein [Sulfurimonas sp. SWIR-19]
MQSFGRFFLFLILSCSLSWGDISLNGYLHPGDNDLSSFTPSEPLTTDNDHTYDYYLNNPTKFYLSENSDITAVELINAAGIDSAIRVYIDGNLVGTGASGSAVISLDTTLSLASGYHDIAVRGSCYNGFGNETDCGSRSVSDIDDFYFSGITLLSAQTSSAYHFIQRRHTGDDNDDDDNYDIDDTQYSYYPDAFEAQSISYNINDANGYAGFEIYLSRVRDIHQNGVNKITVYDTGGSVIASFDLNNSSTGTFDFTTLYENNVSGIGSVTVSSGDTGSFIDDISFGELILIPLSFSDLQERKKPIIDYRMDECSWDNDTNTYEIKNYGTLGNDANATALNDANVTDGEIYTGGNFIAPKQIVPQNEISLSNQYTVTTWIQFPLDTNNHQSYSYSSWFTSYEEKYFNIADRNGASDSFLFFKYYRTKNFFGTWSAWKWAWCVDAQNGTPTCKDINLPNNWNLVSFVSTNGATTLYFNGNAEDTINNALENIQLNRIGASDFYGNGDGNTTIGASMDEFKIFSRVLSQNDIQTIYNNENTGKNYDGTVRDVPQCGGGNQNNNKTTLFNAVSSIGGTACNAVADWENNLTTQIVNNPYGLYILSKDALTQTAPSAADITKVTLKYYDDGNTTDCGGNLLANVVKCDDATSTTCNDTNASGCAYYADMTIDRAVKCVQVYIEGRDQNNTSLDTNSSYSSDDYAVRPVKFTLNVTTLPLVAGADFNTTFQALDANGNPSTDYNETRNSSFRVDANITKSTCTLGNFTMENFSFANGQKSDVNASYSEVGDLNITIKEINGSEFAKVDADDTNDNQRLIEQNSTTLSFAPHHFSIINYTFTRNNPDQDWRYMANVNDANISIAFNVRAQNEQNQTTQNFDALCAATDVGIKIDLNTTNDDANVSYFERINNTATTGHDKNLSNMNFNATVNDSNFSAGDSTQIEYALNVYRVFNTPKEPRTITVTEVNTTSSTVINRGLTPENNSSKFYYARLYTQDLATSKTDDNITAKVLVYDSNPSNGYVNGFQEELTHWYHDINHTNESEGNITDLNVSNSTIKDGNGNDGIIATNLGVNNGTFTIKVNQSNTPPDTATHYIHLGIDKWLWYIQPGFGNDYNYSAGSSCSEHPCIKYNFNTQSSGTGVSSGNVNGVSFDANVSKNSRGIRLLR